MNKQHTFEGDVPCAETCFRRSGMLDPFGMAYRRYLNGSRAASDVTYRDVHRADVIHSAPQSIPRRNESNVLGRASEDDAAGMQRVP